jgi:nitrogen fixation NifU-like protein
VTEHWKNPKNWGIMHDADGYGRFTGPCGDTMEISIKVHNGLIVKCTFDTDGCGTTIACGSIITEKTRNKDIAQAQLIDQKTVLDFCGGLPKDSEHCALLAATALNKAILDYQTTRQKSSPNRGSKPT